MVMVRDFEMDKKQYIYEDNMEDMTQPIRPNSIQERLLNAALDKQRRNSEDCEEDNTERAVTAIRRLTTWFK